MARGSQPMSPPMVFRISVTVLVLLVLGAVIAPEAFGALSAQVQAATLARAG